MSQHALSGSEFSQYHVVLSYHSICLPKNSNKLVSLPRDYGVLQLKSNSETQ